MIKVKAKRTFFAVDIGGDVEMFHYDSQRKPTDRQLLDFVYNITGGGLHQNCFTWNIRNSLSIPFNEFTNLHT